MDPKSITNASVTTITTLIYIFENIIFVKPRWNKTFLKYSKICKEWLWRHEVWLIVVLLLKYFSCFCLVLTNCTFTGCLFTKLGLKNWTNFLCWIPHKINGYELRKVYSPSLVKRTILTKDDKIYYYKEGIIYEGHVTNFVKCASSISFLRIWSELFNLIPFRQERKTDSVL